MTGKGKKVVMLFGQRNRWRVSSICMIMFFAFYCFYCFYEIREMLYKNLLYTSLTPSPFIEVPELSQEGSLMCVRDIELKDIYHTVGTVPIFNRKIVEICKFDIPNTH
jgi:hypothetical protein